MHRRWARAQSFVSLSITQWLRFGGAPEERRQQRSLTPHLRGFATRAAPGAAKAEVARVTRATTEKSIVVRVSDWEKVERRREEKRERGGWELSCQYLKLLFVAFAMCLRS